MAEASLNGLAALDQFAIDMTEGMPVNLVRHGQRQGNRLKGLPLSSE
jgi:hypothetical protein